MNRELKIFSGNANLALAQEISAYLGQKLGEATVSSFSDGEIRVKIDENVRGADVFVVQSCCQPVNDSLMELLIIIDALKRSSANSIGRRAWPMSCAAIASGSMPCCRARSIRRKIARRCQGRIPRAG